MFRKKQRDMNSVQLHSAGATVRHTSPFASLPVPTSTLDVPALPDWAQQLFSVGLFGPEEVLSLVGDHIDEVDVDLVVALLAEFDWRPRTIGAYLAAIRNFKALEVAIGDLFLRSDVCYAGLAYCVALAHFNSECSVNYLTRYLDYYLKRSDLWFEQCTALATLTYLDERNATAKARGYERQWQEYSSDKPNYRLVEHVRSIEHLVGIVASNANG